MKYRKKPVVIEVHQLTIYNQEELEAWCNGSIKGTKLPVEQREIEIQTLEGDHRAKVGDFIIKGIKGEFYPCKSDIFQATYEPVL